MSILINAAVDVTSQLMVAPPMSGAWIPWPSGSPEPTFINNLRVNLEGNTAIKTIFKTIGVIIMLVWVGFVLAKLALPGKGGGGGARQIQWVPAILGLLVAGICLNLETLPNILSAILLAGSSILKWFGIG